MKVTVLLFAAVRDAAQSESVQVDVADDACASDVIGAVGRQLPQIADLLPSCRLAIDCSYARAGDAVSADSELALIPPVSGG